MDNIALAIGLVVAWVLCAAAFYYVAISKWLPKFDELPVEERVKLLKTRRQRYLETFNNKKRR
jgi:hypothetical protein